MDMVIVQVIVIVVCRYWIRGLDPTHYVLAGHLPLDLEEYEYYVRNGEDVSKFVPAVKLLGIHFKVKA